MISFRYHLVSLVAAFLALAVGIVIGTTLADRAIVDGLRNRVDTVSANLDERQAANDRLQAENDELTDFLANSGGALVQGDLADQGVVVVTERGVDASTVDAMVDLLGESGAAVRARVEIQPSWALFERSERAALAEALGTDEGDAATMRSRLARLLVADLASSVAVPDDDNGTIDLAVDQGLITYEPVDEVVLASGESMAFLVITGTTGEVAPGLGDLAEALVAESTPTVLGEVYEADEAGELGRGEGLAPMRDDASVESSLSTVDNLDLARGRITVIAVLADAVDGRTGHYGEGLDVDGPVPPPRTPS